MKTEPVMLERVYEAPVAKVWKAITDKDDMKQWYFDLSGFKPEVGFEFTFAGGTEEKSFLHLCKVIEVIPLKKLKYSWRYDGYAGNSFVTWELFEEGKNKTRLRLTHEGLETFPHETKDFAKANFLQGWTSILGTSLLEYVEVADIIKRIEVDASPDRVWQMVTVVEEVLKWAREFSPDTVVISDFKKGSEVVWKDGSGTVGARGVVVEREEGKKLVVNYPDDINALNSNDLGSYKESYTVSNEGKTVLAIIAGPLSKKYVKVHGPLWDKALTRIKSLASDKK